MNEAASNPTQSAPIRALHSALVAVVALCIVQGSALLSAATFDRLPMFLDVVLVMFGYPILMMIAAFFFDAKVLTPLVPRWLRRVDGHEADLPSLLMIAFLAASVAGIYPGMFPYRTYVHLVLDGAVLDLPANESTRNDAGYYRFSDSTLRDDYGGGRSREVTVRDSGVYKTKIVTTHVAPIVGARWTPTQPIRFWATHEGDLPPWAGAARPLRGLQNFDERDHAQRAATSVAKAQGLRLADALVFVELGDTWEVYLRQSRFRSFVVLIPLGLLVFLATWMQTWSTLRRGSTEITSADAPPRPARR